MLHIKGSEDTCQIFNNCTCEQDVYVYEIPQFLNEIPEKTSKNMYAIIGSLVSLATINQISIPIVSAEELIEIIRSLSSAKPVETVLQVQIPILSEPVQPIKPSQEIQPDEAWQPSNFMSRNAQSCIEIAASFSTKGGAGKTAVATNLGVHSALAGHRTALLDMDIGTGNAGTVLGVLPAETNPYKSYNGPTVENWRQFARNLPASMKRHKSGLYVLPCGPKDFELRETDTEDLIDNLSSYFDSIVLDFGTKPFYPHTRRGLELATKVYVVALQDQGVTEALVSQFLSEREEWVRNGKACLVVNRVSPLGYYKPHHIAKMAGFKNWVEIPEDPQSFEAAKRAGKAVIQLPNSAAGKAFEKIAGEDVSEKPGLISRLFKK